MNQIPTTSGQNISGNRQFIAINSNNFLFDKAPMVLAEHTKNVTHLARLQYE